MTGNIIPHPALRAAERRRRDAEPVPVGAPTPEAITKAVRLAVERAARRSEKLCIACGCITAPVVQFHAMDLGFSICGPCASHVELTLGSDFLEAKYGRRGIHIEGRGRGHD